MSPPCAMSGNSNSSALRPKYAASAPLRDFCNCLKFTKTKVQPFKRAWNSMNVQFSEHDKRLLIEMENLCRNFLDRQASLKSVVTGLEGLFDAGEFNDRELRERWYS